MFGWREDEGVDLENLSRSLSLRVRVMRSCGQELQLILSRAHPNLELQTQNRRGSKRKGGSCLIQGGRTVGIQFPFLTVFKEAWLVLACSCEEGRGPNPVPKWAFWNGSGSS